MLWQPVDGGESLAKKKPQKQVSLLSLSSAPCSLSSCNNPWSEGNR